LQTILPDYLKDLPVHIYCSTHLKRFHSGFVEWLQNTTNFPLHIASDGEYPLPGHGYVAPDDFHMGIERGLKLY